LKAALQHLKTLTKIYNMDKRRTIKQNLLIRAALMKQMLHALW
jgi:hypothetical protein